MKIRTRLIMLSSVVIFTLLFIGATTPLNAQLINENFNYSTGQLTSLNSGGNVSGGNWVSFSGTGNAIQVTNGNLSLAGYASSGIGNNIEIISSSSSSEDVYTSFSTQNSGSVYASFLVNIPNTTGIAANSSSTGDYFAGYTVSTSTSFVNRISIRLGTVANTFQLGIRASSSATVGWTTDMDISTTYLVVMNDQLNPGTANDVSNLWINPTLGGTEPTPDATSSSLSDPADVGRFFIRQGTTTTPNATIDGLRIGTSWLSVAGIAGSANSDILANGNEQSNIDYAAFQTSAITSITEGVKVWSFNVRDGGGVADADTLPTILTGLTITKDVSDNTPGWASTIREAALFDGTTKIGEVSVTGESIVYTGLTLNVPDDGLITLDLYLSFETNATDNSQYQFQIINTNVTAQSGNSSTFSAFANQASDVSSDNNRVEVTATKLVFTTNPPTSVAVDNDFISEVTAQDVNGNTDIEYDSAMTIGVQTGAGVVSSVAGLSQAPTNGKASWSDLRYNTPETGVQLSASSDLLTGAVSIAFDVLNISASSDIVSGPEVEPANISSLNNTQGSAFQILDVIIRDGGGSVDNDTLPTIVNAITFMQGGTNTSADWTQYIEGAELLASGGSLGLGVVSATQILFTNSPLVTVPDNDSDTLQLMIWLKTTLPDGADHSIINLTVNQNNNVVIDPAGSLFASGGTSILSGSTAIDVAATQIAFAGVINNQYTGVPFPAVVTGTDVNNNLDADFASTVDVTIFSGTGSLSGTTSVSASAGIADFTAIIVTGGGPIVLQAISGVDTAFSNSFIVNAPSVFKVANVIQTKNRVRTTFGLGDTLVWDDPNTWVVVSGFDANNIPDNDDDVILDNTYKSGSYVIVLGPTMRDTAKTLTVGYPGNSNTITALIPQSSILTNQFVIGDNLPGNNDLLIEQGGIFNNASGIASGTNLFIVGFSPAKDSIRVNAGGRFIHATKAASSYMFRTSQDFSGNYGTIEYDVPDSTTTYQYACSGAYYPNLMMSSTNAGGKKAYKPTSSSGFGYLYIKGNLTVNVGVTDTVGNPLLDSLALYGDIINYGEFVSVPTPPNNASSTIFAGTDVQEIMGNPITFYNGFDVRNIYGVSLQTDITIAGGAATISGGDLRTAGHMVYLSTNGSLNEVGGIILGTVSASRVVMQNTNESFGNLGFEINALGNNPDTTTVVRTTGEWLWGIGNQSIKRYFDVIASGTPPFNATVAFHYNDNELNGNTEALLFMNKSSDNGTTWTGKSPSSSSTTLNKVTTTLVTTFGKFTLASTTNPLFITHTVTMKKFEDNDGNLNTPGTAKKWYMELYENSIDPINIVNAGNLSVVTTNNLPAGTYICTETDSAGWSPFGHKVDNGFSSTVYNDSRSFDTIVVSNGVAGTFEFYNSRTSSITVTVARDLDGDPLTTIDQTPKEWELMLFKDSVGGTLITYGNTSSLSINDLGPGTYIAVEADSSGWYRCDGTTLYDTLTLVGDTNITASFINVKGNTLVIRNYKDDDGIISTIADQSFKLWNFEVHSGSLSGTTVLIGNDSILTTGLIPDGTYYVSSADSLTWVHLGYVIDGLLVSGSAGSNVGIVTLADGQNVTIDFINAPPIYGSKFRSLNPDSIALSVDSKGKIGKIVSSRPERVQFEATVSVIDNLVNELYAQFSVYIDTTFEFYTVPPSTITEVPRSSLRKFTFSFANPLSAGDNIKIFGFGARGRKQTVPSYWWMNNGTLIGKKLRNPNIINTLRLPMPNRLNIVNETNLQGAFNNTKGLTIGVDYNNKDSAKKYGWVVLKSTSSLISALSTKNKGIYYLQKGTPRGFDSLPAGRIMKSFYGKKTSLPQSRYNNELFADLIALKLSIAASALDKTPVGFGDLILNDTVANPFNGLTLKQLSEKADTMMSGYAGRTFESFETYAKLATTIRSVLDAFEGPMDTVSFSGKLIATGAQRLIDCKILRANPVTEPYRIIPTTMIQIPEQFQLYQNYPNPFNPTTTIQFDLSLTSVVTLKIFNILGQEVATLLDQQFLEDGQQQVSFSAANFASGVYLYRITASSTDEDGTTSTFTSVKKMMLMK